MVTTLPFHGKNTGSIPVKDKYTLLKNLMKNKIQIDKKRRFLFLHNEINNNILKTLAYNTKIPLIKRWKFIIYLSKLNKNSSITRIHNFCMITGRSRSVYKNLKLSRLIFRKKASFNQLVGFRKASW